MNFNSSARGLLVKWVEDKRCTATTENGSPCVLSTSTYGDEVHQHATLEMVQSLLSSDYQIIFIKQTI